MFATETKTARTMYGTEFEYETPLRVVGNALTLIEEEKQAALEDWSGVTGDQLRWLGDLTDIEEKIREAYRAKHPTFESMTAESWDSFQRETHVDDIAMDLSGLEDKVGELFDQADEMALGEAKTDAELAAEKR